MGKRQRRPRRQVTLIRIQMQHRAARRSDGRRQKGLRQAGAHHDGSEGAGLDHGTGPRRRVGRARQTRDREREWGAADAADRADCRQRWRNPNGPHGRGRRSNELAARHAPRCHFQVVVRPEFSRSSVLPGSSLRGSRQAPILCLASS